MSRLCPHSLNASACWRCKEARKKARQARLAVLRPRPISKRVKQTGNPDRNPKHLAWVRAHTPCVVHGWDCQGVAVAHHDRTSQTGSTGRKPPDRYAVRLCDELHRLGHQKGWLWFESHYGVSLKAEAERNAELSPYLNAKERLSEQDTVL